MSNLSFDFFSFLIVMFFGPVIWYFIGFQMHDDIRSKSFVQISGLLKLFILTSRKDKNFDKAAVAVQASSLLSALGLLIAHVTLESFPFFLASLVIFTIPGLTKFICLRIASKK